MQVQVQVQASQVARPVSPFSAQRALTENGGAAGGG